MKNVKRIGLASTLLLGLTGFAQANNVCSGFTIKLKNSLPDDFIINQINVTNAQIQPDQIEKLKSNSEQIFVINDAQKNKDIYGEMSLHSVSLPIKTIKIKFQLEDNKVFCGHNLTSSEGDYSVYQNRVAGGVAYTING